MTLCTPSHLQEHPTIHIDLALPMGATDSAGVVVGDKISITLEIEPVLQSDEVQSSEDAAALGTEATLGSLQS